MRRVKLIVAAVSCGLILRTVGATHEFSLGVRPVLIDNNLILHRALMLGMVFLVPGDFRHWCSPSKEVTVVYVCLTLLVAIDIIRLSCDGGMNISWRRPVKET